MMERGDRPALPLEVLLAGRAEQAAALTDALLGPATEFRIGSNTVAESLAFFAAAMPEALLTRAVVVTGAGGWLRLATHNEPLILVPTFEDPDVPWALPAGHHVLIPEGPRSRTRLPRIEEGLYVARKNEQGGTTRGFHDGGQQKRDLAEQCQAWADRVRSKSPRTAALLDGLAEGYRAEGRWHDERRYRRPT